MKKIKKYSIVSKITNTAKKQLTQVKRNNLAKQLKQVRSDINKPTNVLFGKTRHNLSATKFTGKIRNLGGVKGGVISVSSNKSSAINPFTRYGERISSGDQNLKQAMRERALNMVKEAKKGFSEVTNDVLLTKKSISLSGTILKLSQKPEIIYKITSGEENYGEITELPEEIIILWYSGKKDEIKILDTIVKWIKTIGGLKSIRLIIINREISRDNFKDLGFNFSRIIEGTTDRFEEMTMNLYGDSEENNLIVENTSDCIKLHCYSYSDEDSLDTDDSISEEKKGALAAGSGLVAGSLAGYGVGKAIAGRKVSKKVYNILKRSDSSNSKAFLNATDTYMKSGQTKDAAIELAEKAKNIASSNVRGIDKMNSIIKKAKKVGGKKGAIIGAGLGTIGALGAYEAYKNRNRIKHGHN